LELSREIAKDVDDQVQMHEREILLMETYDKTDSRSATTLKGEFKTKALLAQSYPLMELKRGNCVRVSSTSVK